MTLAEQPVTPEAAPRPALVRRYEPIERLAHWWVVCCFAMTLLSGASLGGDSGGALSGRLIWHVTSAGALVLGVLLLPFLPGRRALSETVRALLSLTPVDRSAFRSPGSLLPSGRRGPALRWGKFNIGQKLMAYALAVLMIGIYATGIAAVHVGREEGGPHGAVVALTVIVLAGHVFLALIYPSTRPALRGMLTGWVDRKWAQHHHSGWLEERDARDAEQQLRPRSRSQLG
jgi:formate dehydrogenase subunit gamma